MSSARIIVLTALLLSGCSGGLEKQARAALSSKLNDPRSAEFENLRKSKTDANGNYLICGEVNAKNQFGGYTGFKPFVASSDGKGSPIVADTAEAQAVLAATDAATCS